jgi:hypothetical protein
LNGDSSVFSPNWGNFTLVASYKRDNENRPLDREKIEVSGLRIRVRQTAAIELDLLEEIALVLDASVRLQTVSHCNPQARFALHCASASAIERAQPFAITPAAFEAIAATLPLGSVGYEAEPNAKGERLVWLEAATVDLLFPPSATVLCSARRG